MNPELIARITHEANRVVQIATDDPVVSPTWDDAPDWQRESSIEGVQHALSGATPRELHESWCQFKENDGWVYGEEKNAEEKTHPCLVDYDDLPSEQRVKDTVFHNIVHSLSSVELG